MRFFLAVLLCILTWQAHAATYVYELRFETDYVSELQENFRGDTCAFGQECYPDDFRLQNGYFAALTSGDIVYATIDTDAGTGVLAGYEVPGFLAASSPTSGQFVDPGSSLVTFDAERITLMGEGPAGANPSGRCDETRPLPGLPDGYCGFYGYGATFDVLSVTEVPLPASALLLLTGLGAFGLWRRRNM